MKKIALISPKGVGMGSDRENTKTKQIYGELHNIESLKELMSCPNSPLLTIASLAENYFEDIYYIDEEIDDINRFQDTFFDVVAMSFMTQQASRAFELAQLFKDKGSYVIAGGMHPSNSPKETSKYFNSVFIGECETTWHTFMKDLSANNPKDRYINTDLIHMDCVPMPRYDLLNMAKYRTIPIQISRGCPHDCDFCASTKIYGPKYRAKKISNVIEEIEEIKKYKNYPHIYFTDDNMLVNRKYSSELMHEIKNGGFKWMTHTDISIADNDDLLKMLFPSGCRKLVIGFESIVPESLSKLEKWKYNRLSTYAESIKKIQSHGVGVWGTFIVGLDDDNKDVFKRVIDFTLSNNLYGAMISVPTPFPGSRLFSRLDKEGRILTKHWGSYTLWNVVMEPLNMTKEELEIGFEHVLNTVYSSEASLSRMEHFKKIYSNIYSSPLSKT